MRAKAFRLGTPFLFLFSSGYMAECEGVMPVKGIYSHISGIDLVKGKDNEWYILEDMNYVLAHSLKK